MPKIRSSILIPLVAAIAGLSIFWIKYEEWIKIPQAREPVRALMKDPDSTQFKADYLEGDGWLCGELNAKNEYGAYVGFKRFMSNAKGGKIYIDGMGALGNQHDAESTGEMIARLDKEIKLLKQSNESRLNGGPILKYSQQERDTIVAQWIFNNKWAENCPSSTSLHG